MRIRQVKPAFWSDDPCSHLSDGARLFYIGLWMLADDAGWLEWNVAEIGGELYRYKGKAMRERLVERYADELTRLNGSRLVRHDCGHAFLTHLTEHQRFGGKTVHTVEFAHFRDCSRNIAEVRHGKVRKGIGNGKGGMGGFEEETTTTTTLRELIANPSTSEPARRAALKTLERMGVSA